MRNFLFGFMSCFFMIFLILFICFRPSEQVIVSDEKLIASEPAIVEKNEPEKKKLEVKEPGKKKSEKSKQKQKSDPFALFIGEYTLIDDPASTLFVEKSRQKNSYDFVETYDDNLEFTATVSFDRSSEARLSNGVETVEISLNDDGSITLLKSSSRSKRVAEYTYVNNEPYDIPNEFKQE